MRIILASSSKQRQDIFNMIGLKYDVITSNEPEKSNKTSPNKYVEELSLFLRIPLYIVIIKYMRNPKVKKKHI